MSKKQRLLWIGSFQSQNRYKKSLVNNMGEASAYASQKGIIKGIDCLLPDDTTMDSVNVVVNPPYPDYPSRYVKGYYWQRNPVSIDACVGYLNVRYLNYLARDLRIVEGVKKWSRTLKKEEPCTVFVYAASVGKLKAALYLKKKYGAKVYVILPDIPDFVNVEVAKHILIAKKSASRRLRHLFHSVDGFILYSSHMADYYNLSSEKWMLMEGVFDSDEAYLIRDTAAIEKHENDDAIRLLYCGSLDRRRCIPEILEMFEKLQKKREKNYQLWLIGKGDCDDLIVEYSVRINGITNYGFINSREEVLNLEKHADILLYTREIMSEGAQYCFPSKLFEYLATGKPIVCVKVPSISEEFFRYMRPIEKVTPDGIMEAVLDVAKNYEKYSEQARKGADFVLTQKCSNAQAVRMLKFANILE